MDVIGETLYTLYLINGCDLIVIQLDIVQFEYIAGTVGAKKSHSIAVE